tara:strand:+ start:204 stop:863 length:660 start_codon:yes stop_codon:yes gene_type:complete
MSLIKIAHFEKQAWLRPLIVGGAKNVGRGFDKNIYRPIFNMTRPSGARVSRGNWDAYRRANPSVVPRLAMIGGLGYGGMKAYEAMPGIGEGLSGFGDSLKQTFKPVTDAVSTAWDNKGTIAGAALPIMAFLATRGKSGVPRNIGPTLAASGALGYGGRQLDNWNRADIAEQSRAKNELLDRVIKRDQFYRRKKGYGAGGGAFVPDKTMDYADNPMGRVY